MRRQWVGANSFAWLKYWLILVEPCSTRGLIRQEDHFSLIESVLFFAKRVPAGFFVESAGNQEIRMG